MPRTRPIEMLKRRLFLISRKAVFLCDKMYDSQTKVCRWASVIKEQFM
jgi:hypothetical protein